MSVKDEVLHMLEANKGTLAEILFGKQSSL